MSSGTQPVIVVGAGLAGLSLAGSLAREGQPSLVLERSPDAGGRVATRSLNGIPFDYGPVFLHGHDRDFLDPLRNLADDRLLKNWPMRVRGRGQPCQPESFQDGHVRWAYRGGLRPVLQVLAQDLSIEWNRSVERLSLEDSWVLTDTQGRQWRSTVLFLTLAHEQNLRLLEQVKHPTVRNLVEGLSQHVSLASLSLAAWYRSPAARVEWDIWYPEQSDLLLISNETSKHGGEGTLLVYQARPVWSRRRLDWESSDWVPKLLEAATALLGEWAARPDATHSHRWRYARMDTASYLPRPILLRVDGCWLGLAGDLYMPQRGMEGSWLGGRELARLWRETQSGGSGRP